jgi:hypothetical protein
MIEVLSQLGQD